MMKIKYLSLFLFCLILATACNSTRHIVILHTNDTHSQIEPVSDLKSSNYNVGGIARRAQYIDRVRQENRNVLLFDAGDFVQGTPYFNYFKGRVEAECMNILRYDAGTLGNHEFDYGLDTLKRIISELNFPVLNCNYDFSKTPLAGVIKPYAIFEKQGVRIGVVGVGPIVEGLVFDKNCAGVSVADLLSTPDYYARLLKEEKKCDMVICLSHIGFLPSTHGENLPLDPELAVASRYIDIIIGGHSHTFAKDIHNCKNKDGKEITVVQTGEKGLYVGRIDITLKK